MAIVRFELPVAAFHAFPRAGCVEKVVDPERVLSDFQTLAAAGGAEPTESEMSLRPAGLVAELTSRPGREVWTWIARENSSECRPVGLVALVRAGRPGKPRWSIGRLVVNPASRRRGVGISLVATAARFAGTRGASVVHVETLGRWPAAMAFWAAARLAALGHPATLSSSGESRKTAEG